MITFFKKILKIVSFVLLLYIVFNYKVIIKAYYVSKTVLSTPVFYPFHVEVYNATNRYLRGDATENPLLEMMHGNLSAKLRLNLLDSSKWEIINTSSGVLAVHKDFTSIENKDSIQGVKIKYSNNQLISYLDQYSESRSVYSKLYNTTISSLNKKDKEIVLNISNILFSRSKTASKKPILFAIPIQKDLQELIPPWVAMHESGILFASQNQNHDFLSQVNEYKRVYPSLSENGVIKHLASHEGSHGDIEAIIVYLLHLTMVNPIYEGIPSALSQPNACYGIKTKDILTELSDMQTILEKYSRSDIAYSRGGCFWRELYSEVKLKNPKDINIWEKIFKVSLQTTIEVTHDVTFFAMNEDERISLYFKLLIQKIKTM